MKMFERCEGEFNFLLSKNDKLVSFYMGLIRSLITKQKTKMRNKRV